MLQDCNPFCGVTFLTYKFVHNSPTAAWMMLNNIGLQDREISWNKVYRLWELHCWKMYPIYGMPWSSSLISDVTTRMVSLIYIDILQEAKEGIAWLYYGAQLGGPKQGCLLKRSASWIWEYSPGLSIRLKDSKSVATLIFSLSVTQAWTEFVVLLRPCIELMGLECSILSLGFLRMWSARIQGSQI